MEVMDTNDQHERRAQLGFTPQKEIVYNKVLPYADKLDEESQQMLMEIKANLGKAVMLREMRPAFSLWSARLVKYIKFYGLKFSKEDHVALVTLMYELLIIPNLEPYLVNRFAQVLIMLLKKIHLLSPEDLSLEWKPLYDLQKRILDSSCTRLGMYRYFSSLENTLEALVHVARYYFPITATQEILDELKPKICPFTSTVNVLDELEWFLPIVVRPDQAHLGYKLWFEDIMNFWMTCVNTPLWENDVMWLMAKLASCNIGYIDWEPYIPFMFSKFLHVLNLPVVYKQYSTNKQLKMEIEPIALWIVSVLGGGSSCQLHLDKFLKTIESYYHPANYGRYFLKLKELLRKLPSKFIRRLHRERYRKPSWDTQTLESHKLTEEDIDRFIDGIKSVAFQAVFSKFGSTEVCIALQHLATLRPKIIIPKLIDLMYSTLDSLTEPHKLTSVMQCLAAVARPLVQGPKNEYPEGPTHVIPLLMLTLPGIDPNDFKKCFVTLQFIAMIASMVPLVDCSNASEYYDDLTEEEQVICAATANIEDFVLQFFDRIYLLIDNSSFETTRMEKDFDRRSKIENLAASALSSVCYSVLVETSPAIFQSALHKLHSFVTSRILETKIAGHLVAVICKSFARTNADETLKVLVPGLCKNILELTEDGVEKEETLDNELLYNMLVLSEILDCYAYATDRLYLDEILQVLDKTLYLSSWEGYGISKKILSNILTSLTMIVPFENRSTNHPYDKHVKDYLPVREWGKAGNIHKLNLNWHVPKQRDADCVKKILYRYLIPELETLNKHISGEQTIKRETLCRSLHIIVGLLGCQSVLPLWDEPPYKCIDSKLDNTPFNLALGVDVQVDMPDGSNVKKAIIEVAHRLQKKMLESAEDDTKSLFVLIQLWENLLLHKNRYSSDFESRWKNFHMVKRVSENKLVGNKMHMRSLLIDRAMLQHECRNEKNIAALTETHRQIMLNLFELSISHYSEVRSKAQSALFQGVEFFSFSYRVLIPEFYKTLQLDTNEHHEKFKGTLYCLLGPKTTPIIARHDWDSLLTIWPAIITAKPSEKLSVIKLLERLVDNIHKHFPTITISLDIPDSCVETAKKLWAFEPKPLQPLSTQEEITAALTERQVKNEANLNTYLDILNALTGAVERNKLHWRFHSMALCFIRDLVHPELPYPPRTVQIFLSALINDSINLRKIGIRSTLFILKQQKIKHKKIVVDVDTIEQKPLPKENEENRPGVRPNNSWLQYDSKTKPQTVEDWEKVNCYHKANYSYYQWPNVLRLYAQPSEQLSLDRSREDMRPEEQVVYDFFSNSDNIQKLIEYHSLEEKKGKDKFGGFKFSLFKGLFRNHGDKFLHLFKPHLNRLVNDKHESSQRCAAEIISGLIRGSKHWPFEKVSSLWEYLTPLIRTALSNMTEETLADWGICYATAADKRDPNRLHWMYEVLMEDPMRDEASFLQCGRMYALQGAINQQEWRVTELRYRLLEYLKPFLHHPFENVRERVASVLTSIFHSDINLPGANVSLGPHTSTFLAEIVPQLDVLYTITFSDKCDSLKNSVNNLNSELETSLSLKNEDKPKNGIVSTHASEIDVAIRLFKTICKWITASLSRSPSGVRPEFYSLFPLICMLESYDQDEDLSKICTLTLSYLSQFTTPKEYIPVVLDSIKKVRQNGSSRARSSVTAFLQVFTFHNMPTLLSKQEWVDEVLDLVLSMIEDERLEVREKAGEVLSGLLHCDFVSNTSQLIDQFKIKCRTKLRKGDPESVNKVRKRHSGVLGLCSFINSSPYDVPDYVPDIFFILGNHLNDPQPIPSTIRKTLNDFKRTHHDNWEFHKLKFTEQQLEVLEDLIVPPTYYA